MPTLRLPRLGCSISGWRLGSSWKPPMLMKPRWVSPRTGCSTLMTSAPQSARIAPAAGTNVNCATSRTRTPSITLVTSQPLTVTASVCGSYLKRTGSAPRSAAPRRSQTRTGDRATTGIVRVVLRS